MARLKDIVTVVRVKDIASLAVARVKGIASQWPEQRTNALRHSVQSKGVTHCVTVIRAKD